MESINFQYPAWFLIFCALLGLAYALVLYYRDRSFQDGPAWLPPALGFLRWTAVTLISALLLSPLLKTTEKETKRPVIVLAQDESESIRAAMDSTELRDYLDRFGELRRQLEQNYEVVSYGFGSEVRESGEFTFDDKVTNISKVLEQTYDLYSNQNLGAVILASDGIFNEGSNPIYTGARLGAPIYAVALGDTIPKKDLFIRRVFHNQIAYLGDRFSVEIDLSAVNCSGNATSLTISQVEGNTTRRLQQIPIQVQGDDFFATHQFLLEASAPGVQRFRVQLTPVSGEATTVNNTKDFFIDVLDARTRVLIVAHSPHPDLSALKQAILTNKNYEVEIAYSNDLQVQPADFDFVIFHQLPAINNPASSSLISQAFAKTPQLFIVGTQTDLSRFNAVQTILQIQGDGRNTDDVQAAFPADFSLFTISDELREELPGFPPLLAPFGEFKSLPNSEVLLYQRIGRVTTDRPLISLGEDRDLKVGVLAAEGLWRWRLFDFLQNRNHEVFDELISKIVQYLSVKEDKRRFRVTPSKTIFNENEPIRFDAELYNESYELINEPDVSVVIIDSEGRDFNFTFNKAANAYTLSAGNFPVGNYTFKGTVFSGGQQLVATGQFSVQPIQLEMYQTTADHGLLRLLSSEYGGRLVYPDQLSALPELIEQQGTAKPVVYQSSKTRSVINLKWIFFLLAGLLSLEWFLRRYFGGY